MKAVEAVVEGLLAIVHRLLVCILIVRRRRMAWSSKQVLIIALLGHCLRIVNILAVLLGCVCVLGGLELW